MTESIRIPVDSEVLAELTRRLRSPDQSFNDLLREWLGLPSRSRACDATASTGDSPDSEPVPGGPATLATPETRNSAIESGAPDRLESDESTESPAPTGGVPLPEGTELRGRFHGREVRGWIEDGAVVLEGGRRFASLSAAARSLTGHPVNGWRFFEARLPGREDWLPAVRLRPERAARR